MFEKASPEHLIAVDRGDTLEYRGRHSGYARLPAPVIHERTFAWSRTTRLLEITDVLEGVGQHRLRWHFHFAPGLDVRPGATGALDIHTRTTVVRLTPPRELHAVVVPAWYSPSYGVRLPCAAVEFDALNTRSGRSEYKFSIAVP
jgi:hypothetical protein